jgi:hypothetical protein
MMFQNANFLEANLVILMELRLGPGWTLLSEMQSWPSQNLHLERETEN